MKSINRTNQLHGRPPLRTKRCADVDLMALIYREAQEPTPGFVWDSKLLIEIKDLTARIKNGTALKDRTKIPGWRPVRLDLSFQDIILGRY